MIESSDFDLSPNKEVKRRSRSCDPLVKQSRPLSVDENQLQAMKYDDTDRKDPIMQQIRKSARDARKRRSKSFREMSEKTDGLSKLKRNSSFKEAQENGALDINEKGDNNVLGRSKRSDSVDSISRPKSPGFLQKLLSKRKSFNDKNLKLGEQSAKDSFMKKMTLKGLFTAKKDKSDLSPTKSDISEPLTPPIVTFQDNSEPNVNATPGSPFSSLKFRRRHTSADLFGQNQSVNNSNTSTDSVNTTGATTLPRRTSDSQLTRPITPHPPHPPLLRGESLPSDRIEEHGSVRSLNLGVLNHPRRPISPKPQNLTLTRRNSSLSLPGSPLKESPFELSIDKSPNHKDPDSISSSSLTSSNMDCNSSTMSANSSIYESEMQLKPPTRRQCSQDHEVLNSMQIEMVSSNSNDSGIQRDVSVHSSSESVKVSIRSEPNHLVESRFGSHSYLTLTNYIKF